MAIEAIERRDAGDLAGAAALARVAAETATRPRDASQARYVLASILDEQGRHAEARAEYGRFVERAGRDAELADLVNVARARIVVLEAGEPPTQAAEHRPRVEDGRIVILGDVHGDTSIGVQINVGQVQVGHVGPRVGNGGASVQPTGPILLGAGAVALISGIALAGFGFAENQAADTLCPERVHCAPSVVARANAAMELGIAGDALWIGGAVLALTGIVLTLALPGEEGAVPQGRLQIMSTPGGALASFVWSAQ